MTKISLRQFTKVIGTCIATFIAFPDGRLHFRKLENFKVKQLIKRHWNYDTKCIQELRWWLHRISMNSPHVFKLRKIMRVMQTDSSGKSWGFAFQGITGGYHFPENIQNYSINIKETLAILRSLETIKDSLRGEHILIQSDNTTAISTIKKWGAQCPIRNKIVKQIRELLMELDCHLTIDHISGVLNKDVDRASRKINQP